MTINFAAIIIALPGKLLDKASIEQVCAILNSNQVEILNGGRAARILCAEKVALPLDVLYIPQPAKPFKLLVCDMESTIIENEFLDEIADYLGIGEEVAEITARAMNGELNFEAALKERIKLIGKLTKTEALEILKTRLRYNKGAQELVQQCKATGIYTMLVSGGFTMFTEAVKNELGFDEHHANTLIFEGEKLVGTSEPILGKEAKLQLTEAKCKELGIELSQVITVGDGANDLPMLHAAGLGVGYHAKPKVKAEIASQVSHGDLATILFALTK